MESTPFNAEKAYKTASSCKRASFARDTQPPDGSAGGKEPAGGSPGASGLVIPPTQQRRFWPLQPQFPNTSIGPALVCLAARAPNPASCERSGETGPDSPARAALATATPNATPGSYSSYYSKRPPGPRSAIRFEATGVIRRPSPNDALAAASCGRRSTALVWLLKTSVRRSPCPTKTPHSGQIA